MIKISADIPNILSGVLEEAFCELVRSPWGIERGDKNSPTVLFGFFDSEEEARSEWEKLGESVSDLPKNFRMERLEDADWQNAYKEFLKPWNWRDLHWVPVWMKGEYRVPKGDKVLYFDAGLAFGTGDHPTTRLCAQAMREYADEPGKDLSERSVIDVGCGSGILALTAKLFGFGEVYGFDRDEEAVRVSVENAGLNSIGGVVFEHAGIERALGNGKSADLLLANIQSDVLCIYSENLARAVKKGGRLVLSGILASEAEDVKSRFLEGCGRPLIFEELKTMGDWARVVFSAE